MNSGNSNPQARLQPGGANSAFLQWNHLLGALPNRPQQSSNLGNFSELTQSLPQRDHRTSSSESLSLDSSGSTSIEKRLNTLKLLSQETPNLSGQTKTSQFHSNLADGMSMEIKEGGSRINAHHQNRLIEALMDENLKTSKFGSAHEQSMKSINVIQQNKIQQPKPLKIFNPLTQMFNLQLAMHQMILQQQKTSTNSNRERGLSSDDSNFAAPSQNLKSPPFASLRADNFHTTYRFGQGLDLSNQSEQELSYHNSHSTDRRDSSISSSNIGSGDQGPLSREQRCDKVKKYWEKKKRRKSQKFIRYECRKNLAEKRFRFQGRFVKFDQLQEFDQRMIYNPNQKAEPKSKQIFKVIKTGRDKSSRKSSISGGSLGDQNFLSDIGRQADQMNLFSTGQEFNMSGGAFDEEMYNQNMGGFNLPGFNVPAHCQQNPFNKPNVAPFNGTTGGLTVNNNIKQQLGNSIQMSSKQPRDNFYEEYYDTPLFN